MQLARASLFAALVTSLCLAVPGLAHAEAKPQDAADEIVIDLFKLKEGVTGSTEGVTDSSRLNDFWEQMSVLGQATAPQAEQEYFGRSRCTCDIDGTGPNLVRISLHANPGKITSFDGDVRIFVGDRCNLLDDTNQPSRCGDLLDGSTFSLTDLRASEKVLYVPAWKLIDPVNIRNKSPVCTPIETVQTIWILVVNRTGGSPSTVGFESHKDYDIDTKAPVGVSAPQVESGEDGVYVSWQVSNENIDDIWYYQFLCARKGGAQDGMPLLAEPSEDPLFEASCELPTSSGGADAGVPDARDAGPDVPDAAPPPADSAAGLDPAFICGSASRGDSSKQIAIDPSLKLGRGDEFTVQLVVADRHHNAVAFAPLVTHLEPVTDFWELYGDAGGHADGGYCFVATAAYGDYDHPFVLVLRDFRDHTLAKFAAGRAFIAWYYRNSPPFAAFIREHEAARVLAQVLLWPLVIAAGTWEYTGLFDKLALLAVLAFVIAWRRRRRAARRAAVVPSDVAGPARASVRRKRAIAIAATSIAIVLGTTHVASAQAVYDDSVDLPDDRPATSDWAFELKFGPYTPDLDDGLENGFTLKNGEHSAYGPYATTYGDKSGGSTDGLLTQLELDRFFLFPGGQLGAFGSIGYMRKWAHSFAQDSMGNAILGARSATDKTTFQLVPVYLGLVYRYTQIADRTVIPIVPYAKLGLAYDLWWNTKGNGNVSSTAANGDAKGGVLGWQGAIGLSLRADAIDPGAARNMQIEMGVEHVGFFAELTYADVSGLGESNKPHLGDLAWSAGINFEF